jgi:hypothetical protein
MSSKCAFLQHNGLPFEGDFAGVEEIFRIGGVPHIEDGVFDRPLSTQMVLQLCWGKVGAMRASSGSLVLVIAI